MKNDDFRQRTKRFALAVIELAESLPEKRGVRIIQNQVLRSSGSVAANYREASRARSKAEFISKIDTCTQEADETLLWLELLNEGYKIDGEPMTRLLAEANEIIAILVTMSKTAKDH